MSVPTGDNRLLEWAQNLYDVANPTPTEYGFTAQQMVEFHTTLTRFASALAVSRVTETRTRVAIAEKDAAYKTLRNSCRTYYKQADGWPQMTNAKRVALNITVPKQRTPKPAPQFAPAVTLVSVVGRTATVRIRDAERESKRALPKDVVAAWVYSFVGDDYPADPALWQFQGSTTKPTYEVNFDAAIPGGTQVWITAAWINAKQQAGPPAAPISTTLQGGGSVQQEAKLKIAA